jgi:hypothetical protein
MWPFGSTERPKLTRKAALASIPRRNGEVETARGPRGVLNVTIRRPRRGWIKALSHVVAVPRKRTFELDERGEWFWSHCDGKRTIEDLGRGMVKEWKVDVEEARAAAFHYAGLLARRGLIAIEAPRPGSARDGNS